MNDQLPAVLNPMTGEVVPLDAPTDTLGEYLDAIREFEGSLREQKATVSRELLRRMDTEARWSVVAGPWKLTGRSPEPELVYDVDRLRAVLEQLVADDLISQRAMNEACERVVEFKARKAGIAKLLKLGGAVREQIEQCREEQEPQRYVRVQRREAA